MADEKKIEQKREERKSPWRILLSHAFASDQIAKKTKANVEAELVAHKRSEQEAANLYLSFADRVIDVLSPGRLCASSTGHDLEAVQRLFSSIRKAVEDGVITDDEGRAVIEFVASGFIEHRLTCVLSDVFGEEPTHRRSFRKVTGRLGHGRRPEFAR